MKRVSPDPVWERTTASRPDRRAGMERFWTLAQAEDQEDMTHGAEWTESRFLTWSAWKR